MPPPWMVKQNTIMKLLCIHLSLGIYILVSLMIHMIHFIVGETFQQVQPSMRMRRGFGSLWIKLQCCFSKKKKKKVQQSMRRGSILGWKSLSLSLSYILDFRLLVCAHTLIVGTATINTRVWGNQTSVGSMLKVIDTVT